MAQRPRQHGGSNNSSDRSNRASSHSHLQNISRRQVEESIRPNVMYPFRPLVLIPQTWQAHNYNLFYRNALQASLSQPCFHRPAQAGPGRSFHLGAPGNDNINKYRFWEKFNHQQKSGFVFSVLSYNVLAQDLVDQHPYLYVNHRKESLKWDVRWKNLLAEITKFHPDILCLQEVQGSHLNKYFSHLAPMGYLRLYKQRTGIRTDGCAIFYKHKLLNLVDHTTVEFKQPNVNLLNRDNIGIIIKFSPHQYPRKKFVVATTHLLYNPRRSDVRLAQMQLFLAEIDRIAFSNGTYLPVILTGDLNSTPDSSVVRFITKGRLKYEHLSEKTMINTDGPKNGKKFLPQNLGITDQCQHAELVSARENNKNLYRAEEEKLIGIHHSERNNHKTENRNKNNKQLFSTGTLSHGLFLRSVYKHAQNDDFEATTYQDKWVSVDYIFYSSRREDSNLLLLERYKLPTGSELEGITIPNEELGSDHLSLLAKFKLIV